ncbi:hypothetical protein [Acinetobacter sp. WCHAc060025]|uniref:hypothetical protein n=1 Tax=Acinetobacter sp. WCHAc060025 TaxID=2518625 RepID=UPI001023E32C|nr:hypothetical protein [Acinetobacter sp. WCHAc060025]RZG74822.1 hypothetical protein EXE09_12610 [Acinetobacter sp. WCHAc060025]
MIYVIAVLAILLLIACVGLHVLHESKNRYEKHWHDELDVSSKLRNEKHHEWERVNIAQEQIVCLTQEIHDIKASFKNLIKDESDFGTSANWSNSGKATSRVYQLIFCVEPNGQKILNDLETRFKRNPFHSDERETCRRLGRMEVYDFILNRINNANHPNYSEQLELAYMESRND